MGARKSAEVQAAVALVTTGQCKTAYEAAKQAGVAESSIHRDAAYQAWKAKQRWAKALRNDQQANKENNK
jgi:hypothetical protein